MAHALQSGLRDGGLSRGGLHAGIGNGSIFNIASLDLNFAKYKNIGSLVTFTRASSGTFVGSDGVLRTAATNEPRFDHNPTTGESLGLLVEEARTNLLLRSEEFDNAGWTKTRSSVTANAIAAPNEALTADKLVEDTTASNTHLTQQIGLTIVNSTAYVFSVYIKAGERSRVLIQTSNTGFSNNAYVIFDLTLGTVVSSVSATSSSIVPVGNGWYRCSMGNTSTGTTGNVSIVLADGTGNPSYTGDGTSGLYLWGAQLEAGAFPTSYIPTTTAAATRSADVASITGSNFSSFYNQLEGTMFVNSTTNAKHGGSNSFPRILSVSDGTNNNQMETYYRVLSPYTDAGYLITNAGASQAQFDTNDNRNGQSIAFGYASNNFPLVIGGTVVATDTSGTVPTVSRLGLGVRGDGGTLLNGTIKRFCYFPTRLANNTLQSITQ